MGAIYRLLADLEWEDADLESWEDDQIEETPQNPLNHLTRADLLKQSQKADRLSLDHLLKEVQ